jgi:mannose-6-phosphate isomerase
MSEADLRREVLSAIMNCDASMLRSACCSLQKRFSSVGKLNSVDSWVLSLCEKYPDGDPGILCFYLMNFETLDVGDAIYIGPNIAHAYLSGELVECMANSDNVVRAGLTPKYKDVQVLLDMLDYQVGPLEKQCAGEGTEGLFEFSFPAEEFALSAIKNTTVSLQTRGAELIFLLEGAASVVSGQNELSLRPGEGVLVSADVGEYSLRVDAGTAYRVSVP